MMIWTTQDISEESMAGEQFLQKYVNNSRHLVRSNISTYRICIVGGGPKGLYALDELFMEISQRDIGPRIEVIWFNGSSDFGCGPNYQVHQPDYLLINYCIGNIDAWQKGRTGCDDRLDLKDWIEKYAMTKGGARPTDFASRALVGRYLQFCAMQTIRSKPKQVNLCLIPEKVEDIRSISDGNFRLHTVFGQFDADNVLLTTGHCYQNPPLVGFPRDETPKNYFANAYPVSNLDFIPARSLVGIVGWGLTFIDVALQLTEGRGGKFDIDGNYQKKGTEPTLVPFSRNHLPILPRGPVYGKNTYKLNYLDAVWVEKMDKIHEERKIDFTKEIYPFIEREVQFAYYSTQLQNRDETQVHQWMDALPKEGIFDLDRLLFPDIPKSEDLQKNYSQYMENALSEAEKGERKSPLMAAAAVWREISPYIAKWYRCGGFTGRSQKYLDKELFGAFCRTSYGPPVANMKKIVGLVKAGIVQIEFTGEVGIAFEEKHNLFRLSTSQMEKYVDYLIDARVARPDLLDGNSALYKKLRQNGLVRAFKNEDYVPGCVEMDAKGQCEVDDKKINLYFYGSNTEGILHDNDSLSREKNNCAKHWALQTLLQLELSTSAQWIKPI